MEDQPMNEPKLTEVMHSIYEAIASHSLYEQNHIIRGLLSLVLEERRALINRMEVDIQTHMKALEELLQAMPQPLERLPAPPKPHKI